MERRGEVERVLQRLDSMERTVNSHTERLDHLDDCLDTVKTAVERNKTAAEKWQAIWDKRYTALRIAFAFIGGLIVAGSGSGSLTAKVLEFLGHLFK